MERVLIFDTTLRDGEQSPGASFRVEDKLEIAKALCQLEVDVIEAGFPIASQGDFEAVSAVAETVEGRVVAGLARALEEDIERAYEALEKAERPRIHVFLATSEIHIRYKLRKAREEILRQAVEAVRFARSFVEDVEFSPEDASRTEPAFLAWVVEAVIEAGASTVNIPDTVGYAIPEEFGKLIAHLKENVPNIDRAVISVHCHNDLGLAVANSLSAVKAGARQVECTVNGLGERAGNASLEEVVMAIKTRADFFGIDVGVNTRRIIVTSRLVSERSGFSIQKNKAIVGENAFAHSSGVHQDGFLKERTTYEIISPEEVGLARSRIVLDKLSGRHAFREKLAELGLELEEGKFEEAFKAFKDLADKKKEILDQDVVAIASDVLRRVRQVYTLEGFHIVSSNSITPTATVRLRKEDGAVLEDAAIGDGPVDAIYKAIGRLTGLEFPLLDYQIRAVTGGTDAIGEVVLHLDHEGKPVLGVGSSTDILEASAKAYLDALNKVLSGVAD